MHKSTVLKLNQLNIECYQSAATDFDLTRQVPWPGWNTVATHLPKLKHIPREKSLVVDLGCGNGRWADTIHQKWGSKDWQYAGYDNNQELLVKAGTRLQDMAIPHRMYPTDIINTWLSNKPLPGFTASSAQVVVAFGFIHHIPSVELRHQLLQTMCEWLKPGGVAVVAAWQIDASPKLLAKHVDVTRVGLQQTDLEPGDYVLTWGTSGNAYRFVHVVDETEMTKLTADLPLTLIDHFSADGHTHNLNRYWVFQRSK